ncbi:prefoldin subunit beta [Candidatus Woesearchaeota archaeon]|jgi:prefoldin beta subunit|nr:prefoldin subunit beta [Candidatus Woesearchaeota archaeon]MBT5273135.1 prefoldin subunit beta [Candidatus Woesearchaeota archaeon]MBT6041632.1 prefoldin subunit beta [Candidatus Woesearchaeota archaeon]MBT6337550.1 prefoldin subunit beta [Candidatus Woesearchaeota archaeon]MBT7927049.1 prefoldin subunit beta [Candidatus Woesearchaeota archaeon]
MSEKVNQLQMIEQNLQQLLSQRQQFQGQLVEVESALEELKKSEDAYKIVGNIMIKTAKDDLSKDLNEKKEKAELRVKTIENQESKLKEKAESIRKEVMQELEKGDSKKE